MIVAILGCMALLFGSDPEPAIVAIGGGPGSGKTTLRRKLAVGRESYFVHDMDETLLSLPGYRADLAALGSRAAFENWWPQARELADAAVREAFASKRSILYDRTCGADGSFQDLLQAKRSGYFIRLIGLTVDREVAVARVKKREAEEGRAVTEALVDEFRRRFSAIWPKYLAFVDEAFLYDTAKEEPRLIFSWKEGVLDEALYRKFLEEGTNLSE